MDEDLSTYNPVMRFKTLEALMEEYATRFTRDEARLRLALCSITPEARGASLDWFDMRWPE